MKTIQVLGVCLIALCAARAGAQTCAEIKLTKGTVLEYSAESRSPQGQVTPSKFSVTVDDVVAADDGLGLSLNTVKWGVSTPTRNVCAGNIVSIAPLQAVQLVEAMTAQGKVVTTTINGFNKVPLALKVGDALPSYQNVSYKSPLKFEIPITVRHTEKDLNGDTWEITQNKTTDFVASYSSIAKYINREVVAAEELTIDGTAYKAFKIKNTLVSKINMQTSSKSFFIDVVARMEQKRIDKGLAKAAGNPEGFLAATTFEWFVPSLGVVAKAEVYDATGRLMASNFLSHLQAK